MFNIFKLYEIVTCREPSPKIYGFGKENNLCQLPVARKPNNCPNRKKNVDITLRSTFTVSVVGSIRKFTRTPQPSRMLVQHSDTKRHRIDMTHRNTLIKRDKMEQSVFFLFSSFSA